MKTIINNDAWNKSGILWNAGKYLLFLFFLMQMALVSTVTAQSNQTTKETKAAEITPYQLLDQSLVSSLSAEKNQLEQFLNLLSEAKEFDQFCRKQWERYRIQIKAYQNILVLPTIEEHEIQKAYKQYQLGLNKLIDLESEINQDNLASLRSSISRATQELRSYETQRAEIFGKDTQDSLRDEIRKKLDQLIETVAAQIKTLKDIEEIYVGLLEQTQRLKSEFQALAEKFKNKMAEREHQRLLGRQSVPLSRFSAQAIRSESGRLAEKARQFFKRDVDVSDVKEYSLFAATYFIFFLLLELLLAYCQRFFTRARKWVKVNGGFWQYVTLRMIQRSLLLLGAILFISLFPVKPAYAFTRLFMFLKFLQGVLVLLLFVQWGLNFVKEFTSFSRSPLAVFLRKYLKALLYGILAFGIVYYLLKTGSCIDCVLLIMARLSFELGLLIWSLLFWRQFRLYAEASKPPEHPWLVRIQPVLPKLGYLIVLAGFFFEMLGYGAMAGFWYRSIGKTAILLMWFSLLYMALKEFSSTGKSDGDEEAEPEAESPLPIRMVVVRLGKTALLLLLLAGMPVAWGARSNHFAAFFYAFNYQISIGDIHISLMDLAIAIFLVFLTHALIVVWKALLKGKILAKRDLEPGLKESITTITGYIGWLIGILIVFRVIGVSMASLAVIFGAVGIGIGFGLQNIFNNFLSGIILLFERPIQVGDVVEVNGTWGTVTKINVRSTQVKTYDNADLIIPNADLISRQLTNWSFKDARVRRTINIGVAYGSDVDLVMQTLIKIADKHPRVYRHPEPQVLFSDFGDSALFFMLRVWAHLDYFLTVETEIRRAIDKEFKELGISIPFPQRDIHIKGDQDSLPASPAGELA